MFEEPESSGDLELDDLIYKEWHKEGKPFYDIFVCGPKDPSFGYDEDDFNQSALKNASLERLAIQVSMRINSSIGEQCELFPFYSKFSTNELCAAFLFKFKNREP